MKIYLAGGMRSGWQDRVTAGAPQHEYIDPRTHGLDDEREYTAWDLAGVRAADLVFACMEADNPSGLGMCVEMGYALGLGKPIVFVDEHGGRRLGMARQIATVLTRRLDDGIALLRSRP